MIKPKYTRFPSRLNVQLVLYFALKDLSSFRTLKSDGQNIVIKLNHFAGKSGRGYGLRRDDFKKRKTSCLMNIVQSRNRGSVKVENPRF